MLVEARAAAEAELATAAKAEVATDLVPMAKVAVDTVVELEA